MRTGGGQYRVRIPSTTILGLGRYLLQWRWRRVRGVSACFPVAEASEIVDVPGIELPSVMLA